MKIIDILVKIANGEEVPMFKYEGHRYEYSKATEMFDDLDSDDYCKSEIYFCELNDEVEILEDTIEDRYREMEKVRNYKPNSSYLPPKEDKKIPEKLNLKLDDWTTPTQCDIELSKKIDEIIDYLKSKGE